MDTKQLAVTDKKFYEPIKTDWIAQSSLSEADFLREVSFAVQHMHKSPYLQKATPQSVLKAVMNLAQVGLTLNPISKFAALVPRYNKDLKQVECVLEPMYQGLTKLLTDSGAVKSLESHVVYEGDDFVFDYASPDRVVKHVPYFLSGKVQGTIKAVYSKAILSDGSIHVEIMSYLDVCEIRDRSESYKAFKDNKIKSCIWVSDEPEMCRKTVIKRHYKYLPKSGGLDKLEKAIELDNQVNGFDEAIDFGLLSWIETMIGQATLDGHEKETYLSKLAKIQFKSEGYKLMDELSQYQPILSLERLNMSITEAAKATKERIERDDFQEQRFKK